MPASPADSALYRHLFGDDDLAALFSDSADLRAMMLVKGALAKVQGALGVIPETAAAFLHRASHELQINADALAGETAVNGVPVAIARQVSALAGVAQGAGVHRQQRDGAAWYGEWLSLPQMGILTGRALALAGDLVPRLTPDPAAMMRGLAESKGAIYAEALSFALTGQMPRDEA